MRNTVLKIVLAVIGGLLGYALVSSMFELGRAKSTLEARLARVAANMNEHLPFMADPETRLDKVTAGPGAQLTYAFTLTNQDRAALDLPAFEKTIRQSLINNYKTNSQMDELRAARVKLDYQYKDKQGELISDITVSPKDF